MGESYEIKNGKHFKRTCIIYSDVYKEISLFSVLPDLAAAGLTVCVH